MSFSDQRVVVMGLGRFGGGTGAAQWLAQQGANVVVTDLANPDQLQPSLSKLAHLNLEYHLESHPPEILDGASLLVVNPAVNKNASSFVKHALSLGIPLTTELRLFVERCPAKIIAVTGTLGKSTTCAMIFDVLSTHIRQRREHPGQVWLGGNIGTSLLGDLPTICEDDYAVIEISSYQLEDLENTDWRAHIAVLTNIWPQHLDRHGDIASYVRAKHAIFKNAPDHAVIGSQANAVLHEHALAVHAGQITIYDEATSLQGKLKVMGQHNLQNAAAACAVGACLQLPSQDIDNELMMFSGLPHRLEHVRHYNGVQFINDSKSTTPQATQTALDACADSRLVLIAGGQDKRMDFEDMARTACQLARAVICFGEARAKIATAFRRLSKTQPLPSIKSVHEFNGGVNLARRLAKPGDVVLFSPGCPSFDEFENFEERGLHYKRVVHSWV